MATSTKIQTTLPVESEEDLQTIITHIRLINKDNSLVLSKFVKNILTAHIRCYMDGVDFVPDADVVESIKKSKEL